MKTHLSIISYLFVVESLVFGLGAFVSFYYLTMFTWIMSGGRFYIDDIPLQFGLIIALVYSVFTIYVLLNIQKKKWYLFVVWLSVVLWTVLLFSLEEYVVGLVNIVLVVVFTVGLRKK